MSFDDDLLQSDLFVTGRTRHATSSHGPLAERLRPRTFDEFVGQDHVLAGNQAFRRAIETDQVPSCILWGPPGSGKTTLAHLIAYNTHAAFVAVSAVVSGVPALRGVIRDAIQRRQSKGQATILFIDEIHRFNKAQQDAFLPYVERGDIILIGATTHNPSFEVIAPLLSRSLVVTLHALDDRAMDMILDRAMHDPARGVGQSGVTLDDKARQFLIRYGNGDARAMLTALEYVIQQAGASSAQPATVTRDHLERILQQRVRYDKDGEEHYNLISAYIKSMRDSDADGALYWLARMLEGGEDPRFIARRMVIFASEDIGTAESMAVVVAVSIFHAVEMVGLPEAQINLAHGTTYLASCPKSNASWAGLIEARRDASAFGNLPVPLHLRNAVTPLMHDMGYGKGYRYVHRDPDAKTDQAHLPPELERKRYYRP